MSFVEVYESMAPVAAIIGILVVLSIPGALLGAYLDLRERPGAAVVASFIYVMVFAVPAGAWLSTMLLDWWDA